MTERPNAEALAAMAWADADRAHEADPFSDAYFRDVLGNALVYLLNPPDDDAAFEHVVVQALVGAVEFIEEQPCTCAPGDDDSPCDRCAALGRWHDEVQGR